MFPKGTRIAITGGATLAGTVIGAIDLLLIVEHAPGCEVYLRRDPASTRPEQWRIGGLPVEVRALSQISEFVEEERAQFRQRLFTLEKATRHMESK